MVLAKLIAAVDYAVTGAKHSLNTERSESPGIGMLFYHFRGTYLLGLNLCRTTARFTLANPDS